MQPERTHTETYAVACEAEVLAMTEALNLQDALPAVVAKSLAGVAAKLEIIVGADRDMRAALYLRVSTARQAEHDVSIPDQKRQGEAYCEARGYQLVETFVEPGASATNDRRPEFQRMIEAGTSKPAPFDVVVVHSFSRFFRDHFELEFYVRKLAKNGVKLVSITQEMGDDPMHVMMRQIMALFDEYQSKENAKHVMRALKENARQGFWNGSLPPIGYRVVAAEQRGAKSRRSWKSTRSTPTRCG
jgi:site-specific DNA recombinase